MGTRAKMSKLPRFDRLRQTLPEDRRTLLLKDTIFELTGAWKFFTSLPATQSVFFYLPGFSALPLAFARHVARVEVLGLTPEEQELLAEAAAAKGLENVRCLQAIEDMRSSYATIVLMPECEAVKESSRRPAHEWQEMISRLQKDACGSEEYWLILRQPGRRRLARQGKKLLQSALTFFRVLQHPHRSQPTVTTRLSFIADDVPVAAQASEIWPLSARGEALALMVSPHFAAPQNVSVAGEVAGTFSLFRADMPGRASAQVHAGHVICGRRPTGQGDSFLERLLLHLTRASRLSWQPAGALCVLPGGKVQVVLRAQGAAVALLKLPLIPYAEVRMHENAGHLLRLSQAEELSPAQRLFFPKSLAQGRYEGQCYFLETFLSGRSLDRLPATPDTPNRVQAIFELWFEIQQRLGHRVKINKSVFGSLVGDHARRLQAWLVPAEVEAARLQRVVEYCRHTLGGRELELSLVHGDFSIKNILLDPLTPQVTGVIDWDLADFLSVPLLDVLHFFVRLDERSFLDPSPAIALRLTKTRGLHVRYFEEARERFGYRAEDWPALVMLYWLFRLRGYIGSDKNMDTKFVRRQFAGMLDLFEREVLSPPTGVVV
jgi:hypothetical protein